jgi:Global regulator protein family
VTVEEIRGGKTVRISVQAPRGIAVHRQEIYERIMGGDPEEDGAVGDGVPAGAGSGPYRPASRARAVAESEPLLAWAAVAVRPAAAEVPDRLVFGLPPGVGRDDRL